MPQQHSNEPHTGEDAHKKPAPATAKTVDAPPDEARANAFHALEKIIAEHGGTQDAMKIAKEVEWDEDKMYDRIVDIREARSKPDDNDAPSTRQLTGTRPRLHRTQQTRI